jgi:hypothetical protein
LPGLRWTPDTVCFRFVGRRHTLALVDASSASDSVFFLYLPGQHSIGFSAAAPIVLVAAGNASGSA